MAITPIEQIGSINRTQDFSIMKHQEDFKPMMDQINIQNKVEKDANEKLTQVRQADNANKNEKNFDAKDKSDNQYYGDGGKNRKKSDEKKEAGRVVLKNGGSFDMKV